MKSFYVSMILLFTFTIPTSGKERIRALPTGPRVIPFMMNENMLEEMGIHPGDNLWFEMAYSVSPGGKVLFKEDGEKLWWIQEKPVLLMGSTGIPLPPSVTRRTTVYVEIIFDGKELTGSPFLLEPQKEAVVIGLEPQAIQKALSLRMTGVDATYIAQVANYLAGNVASLDVMGSTYSIDGVGTVINDQGEWVGVPTGYWKSAYGNNWSPKESNRTWSSVAMSADGTIQTTVVRDGQIYVSTDSGNTWAAKDSNRYWSSVAMSADGMIQTAVVGFLLNPHLGQIYVSTDYGNTWEAKGSNRLWTSVAMSADGTIQTAVCDDERIYVSTDSGNTWASKPYWLALACVAMSADGTIQTAGAYFGRIYVSTDSGNTWAPKDSNRYWSSVAMSADGTIQTAVAGISDNIYVSTDSGNTWAAKDSNRSWTSVAMSADGTIQTAVAGIDKIYVSMDSGNTWAAEESNRGWRSVAMSADGTIRTAVAYDDKIYVSYPDIFVDRNFVGIGTTNPVAMLDVHGNAIIDGDLTVTGACNGCSSDQALKEHIQPLRDSLGKITQLDGVTFDWRAGTWNAQYDPGHQLGVIAQDVEEVFPELVGTDSRGYKYVDYQKLVVPLIEAIKELEAKIEALEAQIQ